MAASQTASVKQRKMAAGQDAQQPGGRSALRALRISLARAARDVFDLPLAVIGATQSRCGQAMLGKFLGQDRMLILLDGPDRLVGAVALDRESLSCIIQQQTTGKVIGGEPAQRPFTGTDAALVAPLLDAMLNRAASTADGASDRQCLTGYRFGARAEDLRSLILAVESERFRIFDLTLEFAAGVQQGRLCLALPEPAESAANIDAGAMAGPSLDRVSGVAHAELTAVIGHLSLPLTDLANMRPGDLLPLRHRHLDRADLVAINGERIASARLGQIGGMRAVRLNETAHRSQTRGQGQFHAGSLPHTTDMSDMQEVLPEMGLPAGLAATGDGETADSPVAPLDLNAIGMIDPPAPAGTQVEDEDAPFAGLTPAQAALEISELAGLSLDDEDGS